MLGFTRPSVGRRVAEMLLKMACGWIGSHLAAHWGKGGRPEETRDVSEEVPEVEYQPV
jgi:hypothetical protein